MNRNDTLDKYFRENYESLVKIARRRVGNYCLYNAEDAVQEAFVRALKYYRAYDKTESLDKWFKGILHNCINRQKGLERDQGIVYRDDIEVEAPSNTPDEMIFTERVLATLNKVTVRDQGILNNYFFYGYKSREISEMMNVSHDVVRDVIRRFRSRIRD